MFIFVEEQTYNFVRNSVKRNIYEKIKSAGIAQQKSKNEFVL
ncbi:MAG: hypothetical protein ACI9LE_000339 [Paraglaciecola sp.]|jgi:hypothetical protein